MWARKLLLALFLLVIAPSAYAQNVTCATRPVGDSSNACASTSFVQSVGSNLPVGAAAKNLGIFTPQQYDATVGSGNDDAVALNSCVAAAVAAGGKCYLAPPSSGHYNVCSAGITIPAGVIGSPLTIEADASAGYDIRVLPGCGSPPEAVIIDLAHYGPSAITKNTSAASAAGTVLTFANTTSIVAGMIAYDNTAPTAIPRASYVVSTTGTTVTLTLAVTGVGNGDSISFQAPLDREKSRVGLVNLRLDGRCVSDDLHVYFDPGQWATGSVFANAKPGGANILIYGGYENTFDATNVARNVNDATNGISCYKYPSDLPAFNLETFGTDGHFELVGVNAEFANFGALNGGANNFVGSHGWGYGAPAFGVSDGQSDLRSAYGYYAAGPQNFTAIRTDDPILAWVRQSRYPATGNVLAQPSTVNAAGTGGTPGYQTVTGTGGTGTKATYIVYVKPNGTIGGPAMPVNLGDYSVNPTFPDPVTGGGLAGATVTPTMASGAAYGNGSTMIGGDMAITGTPTAGLKGVSIGDFIFTFSAVGVNFTGLNATTDCIATDVSLNVSNVIQNNVACATSTPLTSSQLAITGSIGSLNLGGAGNTGDTIAWSDANTHYIACGTGAGLCNLQASGVNVAQVTSTGFFGVKPLGAYASLPTISTCGTTPPAATAGSSNNAGQFTLGTGATTACTVTFATAFPATAACTVTPATAYTGTYYISAQSNAAFTVTLGTGTAGVKFNYSCFGN